MCQSATRTSHSLCFCSVVGNLPMHEYSHSVFCKQKLKTLIHAHTLLSTRKKSLQKLQGRIYRGTTLIPVQREQALGLHNVQVTAFPTLLISKMQLPWEIQFLSEPKGTSSPRFPLSSGKQVSTNTIIAFLHIPLHFNTTNHCVKLFSLNTSIKSLLI